MWPFTREETPRLFGSNATSAILADAHNINRIAQITGIPALAIAGPVAREIDLAQKSWLPSASSAPTSSQQVYDDYRQAVINNITTTGWGVKNKWTHNSLLDLGPGKIKPSTAINLISSYYIGNPMFAKDNLDLAKYVDHWDALVKDMQDPASRTSYDLAYKIYALSAMQASDWYSQRIGQAAWSGMTDAQKAAFITTFDAIGPQRMNELADKQIQDHGVYAPSPGSAGARTILFGNGANVRLLNQLLGMPGATTTDARGNTRVVAPAQHIALPSPALPYPANGPAAASAFFDQAGRTPQYGYGRPEEGSSETPNSPNAPGASQWSGAAGIAPGSWAMGNAHPPAAFVGPDASSVTGNGILSGVTSADASPFTGNGILSGWRPASTGSSSSSEGEDDSAWPQTLQEMWLRRMQDNSYPGDTDR